MTIDPPLTPAQRRKLEHLAHGQWRDCPEVCAELAREGVLTSTREFCDLSERGFWEIKSAKNGGPSRVRITLKGAAAIHWTEAPTP